MKRNVFSLAALACSLLVSSEMVAQQSPSFVVKANQPIADVQSTMYGIFFEDINFAADGGLYAELVKNRSFEFSMPLMGWKEEKQAEATGSIQILNQGEKQVANPRFAHVTVNAEKG
ncbi:MAG: alpha-L-arabinofuranosidase, partial [Bacteroidota bacterium]